MKSIIKYCGPIILACFTSQPNWSNKLRTIKFDNNNDLRLYFLAIGSDHYNEVSTEKILNGYDEFSSFYGSANKSARMVFTALKEIKNSSGYLLTSSESNPITAAAIRSRLWQLREIISQKGFKNSLLLIYFFGHCRNIDGDPHIIPGDWKGKIAKTHPYCLAEILYRTRELQLDARVPTVVLIDGCLSATSLDKRNLTKQHKKDTELMLSLSMTDPYPALFSAGMPGMESLPYPDPFDSLSKVYVGLFAGRLSWIQAVSKEKNITLTYYELLKQLTRPYMEPPFDGGSLGYFTGADFNLNSVVPLPNILDLNIFNGSLDDGLTFKKLQIDSTSDVGNKWCLEEYNH